MANIEQLEAYHRVQNRIKQLQTLGKLQEAQQLIEVLEKVTAPKEEVKVVPVIHENYELKKMTQLLIGTIEEFKLLNQIKAKATITYELIKNEDVKKKLITDNLRMEHVYHTITISDIERFHTFCTNAFYQVENLLTYYYGSKFPVFSDCIIHLERLGTRFKEKPMHLTNIPANNFLNCFEVEYYHDKTRKTFFDSILQKVRNVRNVDSHRCDIFVKDFEKHKNAYHDLIEKCKDYKRKHGTNPTKSDEEKQVERDGKLAEFIKDHNFDLVRNEVMKLYEKVVTNLN